MMSLELAGALTVVALISLGIFIYPWLLDKRGGAIAVAAITVALAVAYFYFDAGRFSTAASALLSVLWALLPVIAGMITLRVNRALKKP